MHRLILPFLLALILGLTPAAWAESPEADLGQVEADLATSTTRQVDMAKSLSEALAAQEEASNQLVDLSRKATAQEKVLASAQAKLDRLERDNAKALLALAQKRADLARLLAGLQRLEANPPPPLAVSPRDILGAMRGAMLLSAVIPDLDRQRNELREALKDVESLRLALATQQDDAARALETLNETRHQMASLLDARQSAAEAAAEALGSERQKSADLAARAQNLKDLLARLDLEKAAEAERQNRAAAAEAEARRRADAARPTVVFAESKGLLPYPVEGSLLRDYPATPDGNDATPTSPGLFLAAGAAAQVLTPADGHVEFAGEFHNFGNLVILDVGDGYLVLLAGLARITVQQGQSVKAGEPVGFMGETSGNMLLAEDLKADGHPVLYVEFRHGNVAVNPSPWWKDRRKEAMR
jgi:septal ring factor EnvC (AmiA/AmiB activator)